MKFVHIGDLHLGKWIYSHSMISQQREVLFELLEYMKQEQISYLVIAGDIYDRLVPPVEAVELFDEFLTRAILEYDIKILAISGNHDSDERLHFGSSLLQKEGLFIGAKLQKNWLTHTIKDEYGEIIFHFLPFIKPSQVRELYPDSKVKTYQEALEYVMKLHLIDKKQRNVLVTHQFVAGSQAVITSESETILSVGGSEVVDVHLFDDYDYVALGHLHSMQKVSRESVCYSGSILRYSFDEVKQKKGFLVVDIKEKGNITIEFKTLHPTMTLNKYQGYFKDFTDMDQTPVINKQDYLAFELLDRQLIANAMEQLRQYYPNTLQLTYKMLENSIASSKSSASYSFRKMTDIDLFKEFYENIRQRELDENQLETVKDILEKVGEQHETD